MKWIYDLFKKDEIKVVLVPSESMVADGLTKACSPQALQLLQKHCFIHILDQVMSSKPLGHVILGGVLGL